MIPKEIGGYLQLDTYRLPMRHAAALAFNSGRSCLISVIRSRKIQKILLPDFLCDCIENACRREGIEVNHYRIGTDFKPENGLVLKSDEWLYLVNYYGQLTNEEIREHAERFGRVIVDQAHGYFEDPIPHVDTIYTCRKWFGVSDGAFLYTDAEPAEEYPRDESADRMRFLLGRYERGAGEYFREYQENNRRFANEPVKWMSRLTENLLHGIDYPEAEKVRRQNFMYLHEKLKGINRLQPRPAAFMYPLMLPDAERIRKNLQDEKIYIPVLWKSVLEHSPPEDPAYRFADKILPLPVDQRYGQEVMDLIAERILCLM